MSPNVGYHRRSRKGCLTCRETRIKCDELRPSCLQCSRRGVPCAGYAQSLKWMVPTTKISLATTSDNPVNQLSQPSETRSRSHRAWTNWSRQTQESLDLQIVTYTCPKRLLEMGPRLTSQIDAKILFHWLKVMPDLIYPHPDKFHDAIGSQYMSMLCDAQSPLLAPTLAQAAVHLAAIGTITKLEALERKQKALAAMLLTVRNSPQHTCPADDAILGSMALATMQTGYGAQAVRAVLCGMRAQLEPRWKLQGDLSKPRHGIVRRADSEVLLTNVKMMAYFDAMCSVPCARPPVIDKETWHAQILPHCQNKDMRLHDEPDVAFGYCAKVLVLTGQAATLIDRFFRNCLLVDDFLVHRAVLLDHLHVCSAELPAKVQYAYHGDLPAFEPSQGSKIRNRNACIDVAIAHGLATQIFLMRAHDPWGEEPMNNCIASTALHLEEVLLGVPINSSAATMMLWPLFVLGCESSRESSMRSSVMDILDNVCQKHCFANISKVQGALSHRIWAEEETWRPKVGVPETTGLGTGWVEHCWRERIELCVA